METPSIVQIRTTIEVLEKLSQRLNKTAARSLSQIPPCNGAGQVASQISTDAVEQTKQVKSITGLLQTWHGELERKQKHSVSVHV